MAQNSLDRKEVEDCVPKTVEIAKCVLCRGSSLIERFGNPHHLSAYRKPWFSEIIGLRKTQKGVAAHLREVSAYARSPGCPNTGCAWCLCIYGSCSCAGLRQYATGSIYCLVSHLLHILPDNYTVLNLFIQFQIISITI